MSTPRVHHQHRRRRRQSPPEIVERKISIMFSRSSERFLPVEWAYGRLREAGNNTKLCICLRKYY